MSLQEGMKLLRSETGYTQVELAKELGIGFVTLNRWENEKTRPNHSGSQKLMEFAQGKKVSSACMEYLYESLYSPRARVQEAVKTSKKTAQKMKYEDQERLTSEQLKMTMDHIPVGVLALRKYVNTNQIDVFYFNEHLVKMLGYTRGEIYQSLSNDIYSFQSANETEKTRELLCHVMAGDVPCEAIKHEMQIQKKDGSMMWTCMRVLDRTVYSFGTELFITYEDITQKVIAQNRYENEVAYRKQIIGDSIGWAYCDITANTVIQMDETNKWISTVRGTAKKSAKESTKESAKENEKESGKEIQTLQELSAMIEGRMNRPEEIDAFHKRFTAKAMVEHYQKGENSCSIPYFDVERARWAEVAYYLLKNPLTGNLEGFFFAHDIQKEKFSESILHVISRNIFDYIGCIYVESRQVECFIQENQEIEIPSEIDPGNLELVQKHLENREFASFFFDMEERAGTRKRKKVMFRYMSAARHAIILAISDVEKLKGLGKGAMEDGETR